MKKKPSLFERFTNAVSADDQYDDFFEDEYASPQQQSTERTTPEQTFEAPPAHTPTEGSMHIRTPSWQQEETQEEGELSVDVYQTDSHVVIKALVAGVIPNNLDITITRDMLTIKGTREDEREVEEDGYFQRELFWGSFSRTILLPEEVDVDSAEATEKHGILVIRLPKINKSKATKLRVKSR